MRCLNCGYEAGYLNLRNGLCKSCRSAEGGRYQKSYGNKSGGFYSKRFVCMECGYEAGALNLVDGLCKFCRSNEKEAEKGTNEDFKHKAEQVGRRKDEQAYRESSNKKNGNRVFACPSCRQKIRVSLPIPSGLGRCVTCGAAFGVYADREGNLYVELMRSSEINSNEDIASIDDCFSLLELPFGSAGSEIKSAYRKKIMEYHPDKVSSLGDKLKALAEHETKKLNYALTLLKENGYL